MWRLDVQATVLKNAYFPPFLFKLTEHSGIIHNFQVHTYRTREVEHCTLSGITGVLCNLQNNDSTKSIDTTLYQCLVTNTNSLHHLTIYSHSLLQALSWSTYVTFELKVQDRLISLLTHQTAKEDSFIANSAFHNYGKVPHVIG